MTDIEQLETIVPYSKTDWKYGMPVTYQSFLAMDITIADTRDKLIETIAKLNEVVVALNALDARVTALEPEE